MSLIFMFLKIFLSLLSKQALRYSECCGDNSTPTLLDDNENHAFIGIK